jgi:hypothetical protein
MDAGEILSEVRGHLGIPDAGSAGGTAARPAVSGDENWHLLRRAIRDLEQSATRVGELPRGYPMHLNLLMRMIHALLPWYTRPIRQHAEHTVAVAKAMAAILERLETARGDAPGKHAAPSP